MTQDRSGLTEAPRSRRASGFPPQCSQSFGVPSLHQGVWATRPQRQQEVLTNQPSEVPPSGHRGVLGHLQEKETVPPKLKQGT